MSKVEILLAVIAASHMARDIPAGARWARRRVSRKARVVRASGVGIGDIAGALATAGAIAVALSY